MIITKEMEKLNQKLNYFQEKKNSVIFGVEVRFYNILIKKVQDEIEKLVLKQIDGDSFDWGYDEVNPVIN